MISVLSFLIQLPVAPCPLMIVALALGRRYAYQDIAELKKGRALEKIELRELDQNQKRIERRLLRRWLQIIKN